MQSDDLAASLVRLASVDQPIRLALRDILAVGGNDGSPPDLPPEGGGGKDGGMEPRIAKLEAHMDNVRAELAKLAALPADMATIKERLSHLPTTADVKSEIATAIDRAGGKTQRTVAITGGLVTLAVAAINYGPKLFGH